MRHIEMLWLLQSRCNYNCPYCSFTDEANLRAVFLKQEKHFSVGEWSDAWQSFYKKYGAVFIYISGAGEPTLFPDFTGLLKEISRWHTVSFDTNLSWSQAALERFATEVDPAKVRVETSFHPLGGSELEEFISKAAFVREKGFTLNCRLVAYPQSFEKIDEYRARFKAKNLPFVLTPYLGKSNGKVYPRDYTSEEKRAIMFSAEQEASDPFRRKQPELVKHLVEQHAESPFGKLCRTGYQYGCIMPDATVYRCQEYAVFGLGKPLGNFFDPDFKLGNDPATVCQSTSCGIGYRWLVEEAVRFDTPLVTAQHDVEVRAKEN